MRKYVILILLGACFSSFGQSPTSKLSDPTMPANWTPAVLANSVLKDITLLGIFIGNQQSTAIINEQLLHEGDFIQGFELVKINPSRVYLRNNSGLFMLSLANNIATPVSQDNR